MKRRLVNRIVSVICLLFITWVGTWAQQQPESPADRMVGSVRSVSEWEPVEPSSGGLRRRFRLSSVETYDPMGRLITEVAFEDDGGILYKDTNVYDAQGRLAQKRTQHSQFTYLPDLVLYVYNERGCLIEEKGFATNGQHLGGNSYACDTNGNQTESRSYSTGKNLVYNNHLVRYGLDLLNHSRSTEQFIYDGQRVSPDEFGMGYQRVVVTMDERWRISEEKYLKSSGDLVRTSTVKYDPRNNTIEEIERRADGTLVSRLSYSYVFDRRGNWIKEVRREWKAEGVGSVFRNVEVTLRKIRYYKSPYLRTGTK